MLFDVAKISSWKEAYMGFLGLSSKKIEVRSILVLWLICSLSLGVVMVKACYAGSGIHAPIYQYGLERSLQV